MHKVNHEHHLDYSIIMLFERNDQLMNIVIAMVSE